MASQNGWLQSFSYVVLSIKVHFNAVHIEITNSRLYKLSCLTHKKIIISKSLDRKVNNCGRSQRMMALPLMVKNTVFILTTVK